MFASRLPSLPLLAGAGALLVAPFASAKTVADFAEAAKEHKVTLTIPEFPTTPEAITKAIDGVIARYTDC